MGVIYNLKKIQVRDSNTIVGVIEDSVYVYSVEHTLENTLLLTKEKTTLYKKLLWVKIIFLREVLEELGVKPEKGSLKVFSDNRVGRIHPNDSNFHMLGANFTIPSPLLLYYLMQDDICLRN